MRLRAQRNATLAACALLCKAWTSAAQNVLFRDITLGVTTDMLADDIDEQHDPSEEVYGPLGRRRQGRTAPAIQILIAVLDGLRERTIIPSWT